MPTPAADWMHLGAGVEESGLPVHDARLIAASSEHLERTLVLTLSMGYVQEWLKAPEDLRFLFAFEGVQSVRAVALHTLQGPAPTIPPGTPWEVGRRLLEEQWKRREESVDWTSLESSLSDEHWVDVLEGEIATAEGVVAVHLFGELWRGPFHHLWVRAEQLNVSRSDGKPFDLAALGDAFNAYWEAFGQRGAK